MEIDDLKTKCWYYGRKGIPRLIKAFYYDKLYVNYEQVNACHFVDMMGNEDKCHIDVFARWAKCEIPDSEKPTIKKFFKHIDSLKKKAFSRYEKAKEKAQQEYNKEIYNIENWEVSEGEKNIKRLKDLQGIKDK